MKLKSLAKGLLVSAAFALAVVTAPVSSVKAAEGTYTVEKDDYLRKIAKKVYGDENLWKVIYDANSNVVKSDYIIYKGQVLTIPAVNNSTPVPTTTPAPTPTTTPAPTTTTPTPNASQEFVLDYNELASWIDGGFVGTTTTNEAVILATNASNDYGIIIFADDSTMTAASFMGPITYTNEYMTIADEANGLALTFTVTEVGDGVLALDMGELGTATVAVQVKETVLNFVKLAIDGYTHVA